MRKTWSQLRCKKVQDSRQVNVRDRRLLYARSSVDSPIAAGAKRLRLADASHQCRARLETLCSACQRRNLGPQRSCSEQKRGAKRQARGVILAIVREAHAVATHVAMCWKPVDKRVALAARMRSTRPHSRCLRESSRVPCPDPCNAVIECCECKRLQRNRAFCYFCSAVQKLPMCGQCGRTKCMNGDCAVRHPSKFATGMSLVGATCDFCDAFLCHSRRCLTTHACACPLREATCIECARSVFECGGRFFQCATCRKWLCEDDQFEHQASCTAIDAESYKCQSCSRFGCYSCLQCKVAYCMEHIKKKGQPAPRGKDVPCPRCGSSVRETKDVSVSTRGYKYGRHNTAAPGENLWYSGRGSAAAGADADAGDDVDGERPAWTGYGGYDFGAEAGAAADRYGSDDVSGDASGDEEGESELESGSELSTEAPADL